MSIDGIGNGVSNVSSTLGQVGGQDRDGDGGQGPGALYKKLQQLQQQDPSQFATVASNLASQVRDAAKNASGPEADRLNKLADGLDQASKTGDLSSLQPKKGAHGHHHHHGGGAAPAGAAQTSAQNPASPTTSVNVLAQAIDEIDKALGTSSSSTTSATATSA